MTEFKDSIFDKGEPAPAAWFTGRAWVKMLVAADANFDFQVGNVDFEPGTRNNWHTHPGGQVLLVTHGSGYYQEKGKPIQQLKAGDVVKIGPDVVHWHGATPDSSLTHIAISMITVNGVVNWLDRVTDEEYHSFGN